MDRLGHQKDQMNNTYTRRPSTNNILVPNRTQSKQVHRNAVRHACGRKRSTQGAGLKR